MDTWIEISKQINTILEKNKSKFRLKTVKRGDLVGLRPLLAWNMYPELDSTYDESNYAASYKGRAEFAFVDSGSIDMMPIDKIMSKYLPLVYNELYNTDLFTSYDIGNFIFTDKDDKGISRDNNVVLLICNFEYRV